MPLMSQHVIFLTALAYAAGFAAFANPCGIALIPAYIGYYLDGRNDEGLGRQVIRGISAGIMTTLGFMFVFLLAGIIFSLIGSVIVAYIPWITLVIAAIIILLGTYFLLGGRMHVRLPIFRAAKSGRHPLTSFFLFGLGYATASLSCTLALFLLIILQALAIGSLIGGMMIFLAYTLGMGSAMIGLSTALSLSNFMLNSFFKPISRSIDKIGGVIMIVSGLYLVYVQFNMGFLSF